MFNQNVPAQGHPVPAPGTKPAGAFRIRDGVLVGMLLMVHWGLAVSSVLEKSCTNDEIAHLTGGYSHWITGDYRLNPENGQVPQRLAALPLLFGDYRWPDMEQPVWWRSDVWLVGQQFFYELGNDVEVMLLQ